MKHNDILAELTGSPLRARLIRAFVSSDDELSCNILLKRLGLTRAKLSNELKALAHMGFVKRAPSASVAHPAKSGAKGAISDERWMFDRSSHTAKALSVFVHDISPTQFDDVERAIKGTGRVSTVILSGIFMGDPSRPADLVIAGDALNERRLERVVRDLEPRYGREIRYATFSTPEFRYRLTVQDRLLRDILDFPHRVLFSKARLFS